MIQRVFLSGRHKGDGADRQSKKQRTHKVDVLFEQIRQQDDAGSHSDDPSNAQLDQIETGVFPLGAAALKQGMERIDKAIVEAKDERDGPAGYAGDAVGQGHAEPMKCSQ